MWYFVIGAEGRTSLAQQYALEHKLLYLSEPSEVQWRQHVDKSVMVEGSVDLVREVELVVRELVLVWVGPQCSEQEAQALREYEAVGRGRRVAQCDYATFRKQLYPRLVIVYNPDHTQNHFLAKHYFASSGLQAISDPLTANQILSILPLHHSYLLLSFTPSPS